MNTFKSATQPPTAPNRQTRKQRRRDPKPQGKPNGPPVHSGKGGGAKHDSGKGHAKQVQSAHPGPRAAPSGADTIRVTHVDMVLTVQGGNSFTTLPLAIQATTAPYLRKLAAIGLRYVYTDVRLVARSTASALSTGQVIIAPFLDNNMLESMQDFGPEDLAVFASMTGSTRAQWTGGSGKDISCSWPRDTAYSFAINPRTMAYSTQEGLDPKDKNYCPSGFLVSVMSDLSKDAALLTVELHYTIVLTGHNVYPPFKTIGTLDIELSGIASSSEEPNAVTKTVTGSFYNILKYVKNMFEDLAQVRVSKTSNMFSLKPGYYKIDSTVDDETNRASAMFLYSVTDASAVKIANSQNGQDTLAPKNLGFSSWIWVKKACSFSLSAGDWALGDKINGVFRMFTVAAEVYEFMLPFLSVVIFDSAPHSNGLYLQVQTQCTRVYEPVSKLVYPLFESYAEGRPEHICIKIGWWFKKGVIQIEFNDAPIPEAYYEAVLAGTREPGDTYHEPTLESDLKFIGYALAHKLLEQLPPPGTLPPPVINPAISSFPVATPKMLPNPPGVQPQTGPKAKAVIALNHQCRSEVDWEQLA